MTQTTSELALTLPGGGSTGLNTPPDRVDIDVLNDNFKKIDLRAKDVGSQLNRSFLYYGPAANIGSVSPAPKDGDEYQESDGNKIRWVRIGGSWVTNEAGSYLIRPGSVGSGQTVGSDHAITPSGSPNNTWVVDAVFSSRFRKYRCEFYFRMSAASTVFLQLRNGGSAHTSANYNWTTLEGNGSTTTSANGPSQTSWALNNGTALFIYGHIDFTNPAHSGTDVEKLYEAVVSGQLGGATSQAVRNGYLASQTGNTFNGFQVFSSAQNFITASWMKVYGLA